MDRTAAAHFQQLAATGAPTLTMGHFAYPHLRRTALVPQAALFYTCP
jgi:hypothetical protein